MAIYIIFATYINRYMQESMAKIEPGALAGLENLQELVGWQMGKCLYTSCLSRGSDDAPCTQSCSLFAISTMHTCTFSVDTQTTCLCMRVPIG